MPHLEDLSSALQSALNKPVVGPLRVECILDPDDLAIDLTNYLDADSSLTIRRAKQIQPYSNIGQIQVSEIRLKLINIDDYFNNTVKGSGFYYKFSRLYEDKAAANTYARILKGDGPDFNDSTITKVTISDGANSETFTISSIDTTPTKYDQINFTAAGTKSYSAGAIVETLYLPGREVSLKTTVHGETEKINQFYGLLKGHPDLEFGGAEITLFDKLKTLLDIPCKANDYRIFTSHGEVATETTEYNRVGSSTGELDLSNAVIYPENNCPIGEWKITITSGTGYDIIDPLGNEYSALFVHDPASFPTLNSYLEIFAAAWSGSFDTGDEITFQTILTLGSPANSYDSIPKMIHNLLTQDFGANLSTADLNNSNFTDLNTAYSTSKGQITFTDDTSVLKAIELLQQHINAMVFVNNDGKIDIQLYRPRYVSSTIKSLSPDADIIELKADDLGRLDSIKVFYDYDETEGKFLGELTVPTGATLDQNKLELRLPAYHSSARARGAAERIWVKWRKGVKAYQITEKFNFGVAFEVGDLFQISSNHPTLGSRVVEIYEVEKDLLGLEVQARAYDLNYAFNNFCFYDVSHGYDTGKLYW